MKLKVIAIVSIMLTAFVFAQTTNITSAIQQLCSVLKGILPVVAMLLVVGAAISYAAGQFLGAETRARAAVWATNMLIGAAIGIEIYLIFPVVLGYLYGDLSWTASTYCY